MPVICNVVDLYHGDRVLDFGRAKAAGVLGIIHKATQGSRFVDDAYGKRRDLASAARMLFGAYHFLTAGDVPPQVDSFLRVVKPDQYGGTLLALDFEPSQARTPTLAQARDFLTLIEQRVGRKAVLYSGHLIKETLGSVTDAFFSAHKLWLAQYAPAWSVFPLTAWTKPWLWQYTDGNESHPPGPWSVPGIPGAGGMLDCNYYDGSLDQLAQEWAS